MLKIKKIKPMFTAIVTTTDKYVEPVYMPGTSIIDANKSKNGLKEYQHVIAIGDSVRSVKVGDLVCINPSRYAVHKYKKDDSKSDMEEYHNAVVGYNFNIINLDDGEYLLLDEKDIDFIIEEYEEEK